MESAWEFLGKLKSVIKDIVEWAVIIGAVIVLSYCFVDTHYIPLDMSVGDGSAFLAVTLIAVATVSLILIAVGTVGFVLTLIAGSVLVRFRFLSDRPLSKGFLALLEVMDWPNILFLAAAATSFVWVISPTMSLGRVILVVFYSGAMVAPFVLAGLTLQMASTQEAALEVAKNVSEIRRKLRILRGTTVVLCCFGLVVFLWGCSHFPGLPERFISQVKLRQMDVPIAVAKEYCPILQSQVDGLRSVGTEGSFCFFSNVDVLFQGIGASTVLAAAGQDDIHFALPSASVIVLSKLPSTFEKVSK